jgi:hypothetical protein
MKFREVWSVLGRGFREGKIKVGVRFEDLSLQINRADSAICEHHVHIIRAYP